MFALLARVEDHISADDMSLLRNLARACLAILKAKMGARTACSSGEQADHAGSPMLMSERACWILISTVVGIWAQRDLWTEAEDAVANLASSSSTA